MLEKLTVASFNGTGVSPQLVLLFPASTNGVAGIMTSIKSVSESAQTPVLLPVSINLTDPFILSLGPGENVGLSEFMFVKIPSED